MSRDDVYFEIDKSYHINDALYRGHCECGEKLYMTADFDADGTSYNAKCYTCKKIFYLATATLKVTAIYDDED